LLLIEQLTFDFDGVGQRLLDQAYRILASLPMLLVAIGIVWVAWLLGGWLARRSGLRYLVGKNPFLQDLLRTGVKMLVLICGLLVALEILDATAIVGAVLGTAGVLGVALAFAFKDILENYLVGILMSLRQPFSPKEHVVIDGNEGVIIASTSRATILMTLDGNHLRLPNAMVFRSVILSYTRNPNRRFEFDIGVGVQEDLIAAQELGLEELENMAGVLNDPPARAVIVALGDSNVQVRFYGWVDQRDHDFAAVKSEAIRRVKLKLEEAGMDMPEPIYRVQVTNPVVGSVKSPEPKLQERRAPTARSGARTDPGTSRPRGATRHRSRGSGERGPARSGRAQGVRGLHEAHPGKAWARRLTRSDER